MIFKFCSALKTGLKFCILCNKSLTRTVFFEHNKTNNFLLKTGETSKINFEGKYIPKERTVKFPKSNIIFVVNSLK